VKHSPASEVGFRVFFERLDALGLRDEFETISRRQCVTLADVYGERQFKSVIVARALCYDHLRRMGKSFPEIGLLFNRDHTTVLVAVQRLRSSLTNSEPSADSLAKHLPMLISMAREMELTADQTKNDFIRGKAEGIRTAIRIMFPLAPKEEI
jgi:hypothetical protein